MASEHEFQRRVLERLDDLPPQQSAIAHYLLDHPREVPFLSVAELARRCGTSEATIVRFARRVGYEGFSDLKMDLVEALRARTLDPPADEEDEADDVLAAVARQEAENIRRTVDGIDPNGFRALATALLRADHVYTFGLGISSQLSDLAAYLLTQIGLRAHALSTRFSSPLEQAVALRPADFLLILTFPPYSRPTLELARAAKEEGVTTAVITDTAASPAAAQADHVLAVRSENMMFTNSISAVVVVLNALATEIARRSGHHAVDAVARINRILAEDPGVF